CVDHAPSFAYPREFDRGRRLSPARTAEVFRRTFSVLLAVALRRSGLGGDRELAPGESAVQGFVSLLVRCAGFCFLFPAFAQSRRDSELGCSFLPQFGVARSPLLE